MSGVLHSADSTKPEYIYWSWYSSLKFDVFDKKLYQNQTRLKRPITKVGCLDEFTFRRNVLQKFKIFHDLSSRGSDVLTRPYRNQNNDKDNEITVKF